MTPMLRLGLTGLAGLLLSGLFACGGEGGGGATFAVDRQAVLDRGLLSLTVETYSGEDATGGLVDCDRLVASYDATTDFVPVGASQVVDLGGENSITVEFTDLPPGLTFFLVLGHDALAAGGSIIQAGCGQGVIRPGEKTPVTVAMAPVP